MNSRSLQCPRDMYRPSMRIAWVGALCLTVSPLMLRAQQPPAPSSTSATSQGARPVITVDAAVHDFGTIWIGSPVQHVFTLTNTGNAQLKITRVQPVCGCTVAGPYPYTIEPGASGKFPFSLSTNNLFFQFDKAITIGSNDPVTPELKLSLRGVGKRRIEAMPAGAYFGTVANEKAYRTISIKNNASEPIKLTMDPQPPNSKFKFELTETQPGQAYQLQVTLVPPLPRGEHQGMAILHTNLDSQKTLDVRAMARIPDRIDVLPQAVRIIQRQGNPTTPPVFLSQYVHLTNYGTTPVNVLEAKVDDPALTTNITAIAPGKLYKVQMRFNADYQPPAEGRTLTIKTDDAERPLIQVPILRAAAAAATRPASRPATRPVRPAEKMAGQKAPAFSLTTTDGKTISAQDFGQQAATVLNFVAPNCPHCRKQVPMIEKIRVEYESKGVRFVNVSQTMGKAFTAEDAASAYKAVGSQIELAPDANNRVGMLFQATSYPTLFVIRPDGIIARVLIGDRPEIDAMLRAQLNMLTTATIPPAAK